MSEEYKVTLPLFENGELESILNMPNLVSETAEAQLKEKEHIILQKCIKKQQKEIEELKRHLKTRIKYTNELEKDLFENCSNYVIPKQKIKDKIEEISLNYFKADYVINEVIEILQELLEENK